MKYKRSFLLILILSFVSNVSICNAKDSILVFKIGLGSNWSKWTTPENFSAGGGSGGGSFQTDSSYKNGTSLSPVFNLRVTARIHENFNLFIEEKYNSSYLEYTYNRSSQTFPIPPLVAASYYEKVNHSFFIAQFTSSIGIEMNISHFYIAPKGNLTYSSFSETIKTTSTYSNIDNSTAYKKKNAFSYGLGIHTGYNFKIKKVPLFIEYEFDVRKTSSKYFSEVNNSILIGIKL